MPWFRTDDGFHSHPKRAMVDVATDGLWVRAGSYCAGHSTDGFIAASWVQAQLKPHQRKRVLEEALSAGLLEPFDAGDMRVLVAPKRQGLRPQQIEVTVGPHQQDGYLVHDFLHYNRARSEIEELRAGEANKKRAQRARDKQGTLAWDEAGNGHVPKGQVDLSPGESPLGGLREGKGRTTERSEPRSEVDARTPELAAQVAEVVAVLGQCDRLHIDSVGVENAIVAWPDCDPVQAARGVVTAAVDPAFRYTNGSKLLYNELSRAKALMRPTRGRAGSTSEQEKTSRRRSEALRDLAGLGEPA